MMTEPFISLLTAIVIVFGIVILVLISIETIAEIYERIREQA